MSLMSYLMARFDYTHGALVKHLDFTWFELYYGTLICGFGFTLINCMLI